MTLTEAACGAPAVAIDIAGRTRMPSTTAAADCSADPTTSWWELATGCSPTRRPGSALRARALERAGELTWEACALANFRVLADDAAALAAVGGRRRRLPQHPRGRSDGRAGTCWSAVTDGVGE